MYALPDRKPRLCLSTRPVFVQEPIGKKGFHTRRKRGPQSGDRRNQIEASILTRTLFTHPPTLWQARKPATPFSFLLPSSFVPLSSPSRPPAQCMCPRPPHMHLPHMHAALRAEIDEIRSTKQGFHSLGNHPPVHSLARPQARNSFLRPPPSLLRPSLVSLTSARSVHMPTPASHTCLTCTHLTRTRPSERR